MKYDIEATKIYEIPQQFIYEGKLCVKWYTGCWHVLESGTNPIEGLTIKWLSSIEVINYLNSLE